MMTLSASQLRTADSRREKLVALCGGFPEVTHESVGQGHIVFQIRKKNFAYYTIDHHGDGKIAFWCKSTAEEQQRLIRSNPRSYFFPAYVGKRGWIGIRLDEKGVDWGEVVRLARGAYRKTAPKRLQMLI